MALLNAVYVALFAHYGAVADVCRLADPDRNGIVERFNGAVRAQSDDDYGNNYLQVEATIGKLMHHYNEERLHAALAPAT